MTRLFQIIAALLFSTSAFAANTATQTFTLGQTTESFDRAFTFAQFNPALGNLTSIHMSLAGSDVANATIMNSGSTSTTITFTNQSDLFITDATQNVTYSETLPTGTQSMTIAAGASKSFSNSASSFSDMEFDGNISVSTTFVLVSNAGNGSPSPVIDASSFVGSGAVNLLFGGDNVSSCSPNGSCTVTSRSATGGGTVSLFYDYTPNVVNSTPEPASVGLLGSALVGFGFLKALRKKFNV